MPRPSKRLPIDPLYTVQVQSLGRRESRRIARHTLARFDRAGMYQTDYAEWERHTLREIALLDILLTVEFVTIAVLLILTVAQRPF